ncbi:MAG: glycosyltransferase, partial [Flavobacteriales bacterium]|nr:glycosyltransferase [Flavobacteriales bacterium]
MNPSIDLSLVVPLFNESESLVELKAWIDRVLVERTYEVIFVDDGSKDNSWEIIEQLHAVDPERVVGIRFSRNYGKSAGLQKGFESA